MILGSGCSLFKHSIIQPLCLPERPQLVEVTNEQKYQLYLAEPTALEALAVKDLRLKSHIETLEEITEIHNKQFEAKCP